jgi:N-acetylneuraminate synthase
MEKNNKVKVIAEIGINHNGDIEIAKQLIMVAKAAGCDYVKFQKRNPDVCVPEDQKSKMRQTPWGEMTYLEYKWKTEFGEKEYDEIDRFCKQLNIGWFASVWDMDSVDFMMRYKTDLGVVMKIPSALITDINLCQYARQKSDYLMISTGMSDECQIDDCVLSCQPDVIMHTNSTYPCPVEELNLNYISWLKRKWVDKEIGYSGHEYGLVTTFATIPMGVTWVERHITLDRTMWGSDHSASIEPSGLFKLVKGIRDIEAGLSIPIKARELFGGELAKMKTLRK